MAPEGKLCYNASATVSSPLSHNLQDVFAVADRVVVMRRGKKVAERPIQETTMDELVSLMVGGSLLEE